MGSGSCPARCGPAQKGDLQMEILQVKQIHKIYGEKENKVHALRDVSFTVDQGEFIAIVGTSGSGKSTLFKSHRRTGHAHTGTDHHTGTRYRVAEQKGADDLPEEEYRIRLSELQSDAGPERV